MFVIKHPACIFVRERGLFDGIEVMPMRVFAQYYYIENGSTVLVKGCNLRSLAFTRPSNLASTTQGRQTIFVLWL